MTKATQTEPTPTELFTAPTLAVTEADIRNFQNRSRVDSLAIIICAVSYGSDLRKLEKLMRGPCPAPRRTTPSCTSAISAIWAWTSWPTAA